MAGLVLAALVAVAQPVGRDLVVCRSRERAVEWALAARTGDRRQADALLQSDACHWVAGEHAYSVVRRDRAAGVAEIRVYVGRVESFLAWVPLGALP